MCFGKYVLRNLRNELLRQLPWSYNSLVYQNVKDQRQNDESAEQIKGNYKNINKLVWNPVFVANCISSRSQL